jgi:hypothetical protein
MRLNTYEFVAGFDAEFVGSSLGKVKDRNTLRRKVPIFRGTLRQNTGWDPSNLLVTLNNPPSVAFALDLEHIADLDVQFVVALGLPFV